MAFNSAFNVYNTQNRGGVKIYLNIYNLSPLNYYLHSAGFGVYHTGVQIGNVEYSFGYHDGTHTGVCECEPKGAAMDGVQFRQSLYMGETQLSEREIRDVLGELSRAYAGNTYDLFARNCNCFSQDLCLRLLNKPIPAYINRIAKFAHYMRCCIPQKLLNNNNNNNTNGANSSISGQSTAQRSGNLVDSIQLAKRSARDEHKYKSGKNKNGQSNVHTLHFTDDQDSEQ